MLLSVTWRAPPRFPVFGSSVSSIGHRLVLDAEFRGRSAQELERMMEAVHRYEGTGNQVMGDGIMALFGAPLAHEDHAVRACYASLRMQEVVRPEPLALPRGQRSARRSRPSPSSGQE